MVLVSETMLQQTQTTRVAEALPRFLERFPSVHALASASNAEIVRQWKGMGYNSRALRLRDAARAIVEVHGGRVPTSVDVLRTLPGVGPYTAAAVASFAFDRRVVVLDVNIRRVYSRWVKRQPSTTDVEADDVLTAFALDIIPRRSPSEWHHAVMDLGATICTARDPRCGACPLENSCASAHAMERRTRERKAEPMFRGEPQRLWRGRFIEVLRGVRGAVSEERLFRMAAGGPLEPHESEWYGSVLDALERGGFVHRSGGRVRLAT
jgi:A/G-specific adenine glycosylase